MGYVYWIQFFVLFSSMSAVGEGYRETWYRNADKALLIFSYRVIARLKRIHDGTIYLFFFFFFTNDSIVKMIDYLKKITKYHLPIKKIISNNAKRACIIDTRMKYIERF